MGVLHDAAPAALAAFSTTVQLASIPFFVLAARRAG